MTIVTRATERLGIRHPIVLAPMGGVSGGRLAAAISQAGGLGLIGGGYGDPEWLEHELGAAGNAPVGIGFITWSLQKKPELLDLALERQPRAIMLAFGSVEPFAEKVRRAGALLICQVQTLAQAREAVEAGADVLVAQGSEAGGHAASRATLPLVPAVADAAPDIPVLAAGGIADGRGLAAALMLGADGVLMGTRFYASHEALGSPAIKQRIAQASGDDTVRTRVFDIIRRLDWPAIYPGHAIANAFSRHWHGRESELERDLAGEEARYRQAAQSGDFDTAAIFAGEAVDLIPSIEPAADILESVMADAETRLKAGQRLVH